MDISELVRLADAKVDSEYGRFAPSSNPTKSHSSTKENKSLGQQQQLSQAKNLPRNRSIVGVKSSFGGGSPSSSSSSSPARPSSVLQRLSGPKRKGIISNHQNNRNTMAGRTKSPIVPVARQHQIIKPETEAVPERKVLSGKALELQLERERMKERRQKAMLKSKKSQPSALQPQERKKSEERDKEAVIPKPGGHTEVILPSKREFTLSKQPSRTTDGAVSKAKPPVGHPGFIQKRNHTETEETTDYEKNYSSVIQKMFGYDKSKYSNDFHDDLDNMESDYRTIEREERLSSKIGQLEDRIEAEKEKKRSK